MEFWKWCERTVIVRVKRVEARRRHRGRTGNRRRRAVAWGARRRARGQRILKEVKVVMGCERTTWGGKVDVNSRREGVGTRNRMVVNKVSIVGAPRIAEDWNVKNAIEVCPVRVSKRFLMMRAK